LAGTDAQLEISGQSRAVPSTLNLSWFPA
jgi:hypothetical protein